MREPHSIKKPHKSNTHIKAKYKKKENTIMGASFSPTILHAQIHPKRRFKLPKNYVSRLQRHRSNHCRKIPRKFEVQNLPLYFGAFKIVKIVRYEQELGEEQDYIAGLIFACDENWSPVKIFANGTKWAPTKFHLRRQTT